MMLREHVPLLTLTTLRVGGNARYVAECSTLNDVRTAVAFARDQEVPVTFLGEGSNVLASDSGYEGVVLHVRIPGIDIKEEGDTVLLKAGAGIVWDALVTQACVRGLWGLENLAGIPGTVGAAPVQNIGAYGAELSDCVREVSVFDVQNEVEITLTKDECEFAYRDSVFKRRKELLITSVTFALTRSARPRVTYADLQKRITEGVVVHTPSDVARTVREIRARKFPDMRTHGTAGSFFKNPFISTQLFKELQEKYPGLPGFPQGDCVKIPIAWILDHVLNLRGFAIGPVSQYEHHSLVLVTKQGATAHDVDVFASHIVREVERVTSIVIEREVRVLE